MKPLYSAAAAIFIPHNNLSYYNVALHCSVSTEILQRKHGRKAGHGA